MEDKRPVGRPTKYKPEYCQAIIDFMATGDSLVAFAAHIEVAPSQIYVWEEKHPDFQEAIKIARAKCQAWWEKQLKDGIFTDKETRHSHGSVIFKLKSRFGYRDKPEIVEAAKEFQKSYDLSKMTKEEYKEFKTQQYKDMLKKGED